MLARVPDGRHLSEPGIYNWDIAADRVYGDTAVAFLFGLEPGSVDGGLPIECIVERIHPADRDDFIQAFQTAVITASALQVQCLIRTSSEEYAEIVVHGRCFFESGAPRYLSGVLHALPAQDESNAALSHLVTAHALYEREGHKQEANWVLDLLARIVKPEFEDRVASLAGK